MEIWIHLLLVRAMVNLIRNISNNLDNLLKKDQKKIAIWIVLILQIQDQKKNRLKEVL